MNWEISGVWGDGNMPAVGNLEEIPFFGYWDSSTFTIPKSELPPDLGIFTAIIVEAETKLPLGYYEQASPWFNLHSGHQTVDWADDYFSIRADQAGKDLTIRTYFRTALMDIYPKYNGITKITVGFADYLEMPDMGRIKETITFKTQVTVFEAGNEQRRSKGTPKRTWSITMKKSNPHASAVLRFFNEKQGTFQPFYWRNPLDGFRYKVRFANPTLSFSSKWRTENSFQIQLVEVI